MSKQSYRLKGNSKVYIAALSDLHLGSSEFNEDYFQYALDVIDDIKQPKRIYLCGDLVEAASLKVGNSAFHTDISLDEQLDTIVSYFKPFKKDIICCVPGNHEARLQKDYDFSLPNILGKTFNCKTDAQVLDTFNINDNPFTIYARHGKGSAAYNHLAMGKIIRETQHIDATLYMEGHNHRSMYFTLPLLTSNGIKRKYYLFTGAFLKYNKSYAQNMYLPILPEAFQILSIDRNMIVNNTSYMIDERRPDLLDL